MLFDDFEPKINRKRKKLLSLDEDLIKELKKRPDINVSGLVNSFLWYYIKREEGNK